VECDLLRFDLAVLNLNLVPGQNNRNILAHASQVAVPVRNIFVSDATRHVKHDNSALPLNIVTVSQSPKLFLSGSIPDIKFNRTSVGVKGERMDLHTQSRDVFLFKFARQVAFHEGRFTDATVAEGLPRQYCL
jgi:hypothetical protein